MSEWVARGWVGGWVGGWMGGWVGSPPCAQVFLRLGVVDAVSVVLRGTVVGCPHTTDSPPTLPFPCPFTERAARGRRLGGQARSHRGPQCTSPAQEGLPAVDVQPPAAAEAVRHPLRVQHLLQHQEQDQERHVSHAKGILQRAIPGACWSRRSAHTSSSARAMSSSPPPFSPSSPLPLPPPAPPFLDLLLFLILATSPPQKHIEEVKKDNVVEEAMMTACDSDGLWW